MPLNHNDTLAATAFQVAVCLQTYLQEIDLLVVTPLDSDVLQLADRSLDQARKTARLLPDASQHFDELSARYTELKACLSEYLNGALDRAPVRASHERLARSAEAFRQSCLRLVHDEMP